jgi:hypothetical protein
MAVERRLEPLVRSEYQFPHLRVKPVGADDEIESVLSSVGEYGGYALAILLDTGNRHTEAGLDAVAGLEEDGGEIGSRKADEAALKLLSHRRDVHPCDLATLGVDHAQPFHLVAAFEQRRDQSHTVRDLEPETPKVDDVSACAQSGRFLKQDRFVTESSEPVRERRTRDARSVDRDSHLLKRLLTL